MKKLNKKCEKWFDELELILIHELELIYGTNYVFKIHDFYEKIKQIKKYIIELEEKNV
jgi:hypothetical protein